MKKTHQVGFNSEIPNFQPIEFDGTRLDKKGEYFIVFNSRRDVEKAYKLLKKEGFDCRMKF